MIEFLQDHWGSVFSVLGVLVSAIGLGWAVFEARGARSAAQAAERATLETRERIGRHLVVVDLERAVALIQRLKLLHRDRRWDAALEQYQSLRSMIVSVMSRYSDMEPTRREQLISAIELITLMEQQVETLSAEEAPADDINGWLNRVQVVLEEIASEYGFSSERGEV